MYIALKPCTIAGKKYLVDDTVDTSVLTNKEVASLVKRRMIAGNGEGIAHVDAPAPPESPLLAVPILGEAEPFAVALTNEQIVDVFTVLQMNADDAAKAIGEMTEENPLIVIHRIDERKTVKKAAEARAKEITEAAEGGETQDNSGEGEK